MMKPRFDAIAHASKQWDATDTYRGYMDPNLVKVFAKNNVSLEGYGKLFYSPSTDQVWESATGNKQDAKLVK